MRHNLWAAGALAAGLLLAACSSGGSSSSGGGAYGGGSSGSASTTPPAASSSVPISGSGTGIKIATTSIGQVLVTTDGLAIYWFAADTPGKSNCTGSCASYWPPVKGPVSAASGVTLPGNFGTITRPDGTAQATYEGHPLYTYSGDPSPGTTTGNGLNLSGGLWWAMTPTGATPSSSPSASPTKAGYGY